LDVSQLKRSPRFQNVSDDALTQVSTFATAEEFPEGSEIVKEGGYSNDFYAIEDGTAKVEQEGKQVAELGPGDVFGEQGLLEQQERSATVIATSQIKLIKIEHWELSRMKNSMPEVVDQLRKQVEERSS
jgi:CRP/FNR family cyclic AMP-dependent transcriptional regulator